MRISIYNCLLVLLLFSIGCKDPYEINVSPLDLNRLIVEGQITNAPSSSYVYLSRSVNVNDQSNFVAEVNAKVYVEDEDGTRYTLSFDPILQRYEAPLNLDLQKKYRIYIETTDGNIFVSTYAEILNTPEIGEIDYRRAMEGMELLVNTQDVENKINYFRWTFEEDWEINSVYRSYYYYDDEEVELVDSNMYDAYYCYKNNKSTSIILGATDKLSSSTIKDYVFHKIPNKDDRFSVRYSILVKQYALSREGYLFLDIMRKNTESLGSIFDPQPSELVGNVVCLNNPDIKVLGYVEASQEKTKRIFIYPQDIPDWGFMMYCSNYTVPKNRDSMMFYFPSPYLPYDFGEEGIPSATSQCVDCRLRGGNNNKPSFW